MRILIVGAGAIGGYFGGRLLQHGRDVTFLVRERRAAQLAQHGLSIRSPHGDVALSAPPCVLARDLRQPFELVVLTCKAYDLDAAMEDVAPAVGERTAILPLLNGMRHLDRLDARFGAAKVLGGLCAIPATLDGEGVVRHLGSFHDLMFGERAGGSSARIESIAVALTGAGFDARRSGDIVQDMWEKWVFLAALAGITCLMRASIGEIVSAAGGREVALALWEECCAVAARAGHAPSDAARERSQAMLTKPGSTLTASMLRDLQGGARIEADQVIGDMLARTRDGLAPSALLRVVYAHLKTYEAVRARQL